MEKNMNDQELKAFLQKHQPIAPPAESGEMEKILARIQAGEKKVIHSKKFLPWLASGLTAAAVLAIFLVNEVERSKTITPVASTSSITEETTDIFDEELPDQVIGEGYLQLAGLSE